MSSIGPEAEIAGRRVGFAHPPYVVAEISGNHKGDINRALAIIDAAAAAGADAIKLQTYTADTITIDSDEPQFRINGGLWHGRKLYDLYEEAHTPWAWHEALFRRGRQHGLAVFSSPFDPTAIDFLESLDAPAYKIASFEAIDLPLIERAANTGKPLIISTGMANLAEIEEAVSAARRGGCRTPVLLHCVSGYPSPVEETNLLTIGDLRKRFDLVVGLSDHTLGVAVAVAAVALGAAVIEKHVTLARADGGPDAEFSLEPAELKTLVDSVRTAWAARGAVDYSRKPSEATNALFRRSLYVVADVAKGDVVTAAHVRSIRPGYGLAPKYLPQVIGRRATRDLKRGEALSFSMIDAPIS